MCKGLELTVIKPSTVALHDMLVHYMSGGKKSEWIIILAVDSADIDLPDEKQRKYVFFIRPDPTRCKVLSYIMADDHEIIPCKTINGEKLDVTMPPTAWKQDRPAEIRLSREISEEIRNTS